MHKRGLILIVAIFICSMGLLSAISTIYGEKLNKNYNGGDIVSGIINISFNDEPANGKVESNFNGNITLLNWLRASPLIEGIDYNCSTSNCNDLHTIQGSGLNEINFDGSKTIALRINGNEESSVGIDSLDLVITNDISSSCDNVPLKIDFLGDGSEIFPSTNYVDEACYSKNYGCFNLSLESSSYSEAIISENSYCEKVKLRPAPAYRIGAKIKNTTGGKSENLFMELRDFNNNIERCKLDRVALSEEEKDCLVNYSSLEAKEVLICINAEEGSDSDYSLRTESAPGRCGTDDGGTSYVRDYELFFKPLKYGSTNLRINDAVYSGKFGAVLTSKIQDYLLSTYDNICSPYCLIPIKLEGPAQKAMIKNIKISYKQGSTQFWGDSKFYEASVSPAKIKSGKIALDVSYANITIPIESNEKFFKLRINDIEKLNVPVNITKGLDFDVYPKFFLLGINTNLFIVGSANISSSEWKFSNETEFRTASGGKIAYKFLQKGTNSITVKAKKGAIETTKTFNVEVGNANESANRIVKDYDARLANITRDMGAYAGFLGEQVSSALGFEDLKKNFSYIKQNFNSASTDEEYASIVNELIALNMPSKIYTSKTSSAPLAAIALNADAGLIESLSETSDQSIDSEKVKRDISSWTYSNYNANVNYKLVSAMKDGEKITLVSYASVDASPKTDLDYPVYFFVSYPRNEIIFSSNYNEKEIEGGTYISLTNQQESISFSVPGEISLQELGIYISPELKNLGGNYASIGKVEKPVFKTFWFWSLMGALLVFTLIVYLILQEWYKRYYESHLFKNRDDLYNVINFIYNSRYNNLQDYEIRRKLLNTGWTREQMVYAFRKIDGKRTGMFEIPVFKWKENQKVAEEIAKRQGGKVDARFIKQSRPY